MTTCDDDHDVATAIQAWRSASGKALARSLPSFLVRPSVRVSESYRVLEKEREGGSDKCTVRVRDLNRRTPILELIH